MPQVKSVRHDTKAIERRLAALEEQIAELAALIEHKLEPKRDWRKAVGIFTGDDGMREFFEDAQKLRAADRAKVRRSTKSRGKP